MPSLNRVTFFIHGDVTETCDARLVSTLKTIKAIKQNPHDMLMQPLAPKYFLVGLAWSQD